MDDDLLKYVVIPIAVGEAMERALAPFGIDAFTAQMLADDLRDDLLLRGYKVVKND